MSVRWASACALAWLLGTAGCGTTSPVDGGAAGSGSAQPASSASAAASATGSAPSASATGAADPPAVLPSWSSSEPVDVWIKGGSVVDGTGHAPARADVLVKDGRIVHVGGVAGPPQAARTIDAAGSVVAPGFIDAHAHGDPEASLENFIAQGVTTLCVGQDGVSPSGDRFASWVKRISKRKLRINVLGLIGHATVRSLAGVGGEPHPTAKQLEKMAKLVGQELDAGAFGLSTALEYPPGLVATTDELVAIAKPVGERSGIVMSHLRSEDDDAIDAAIDELVTQGRGSGARVHIAHLKVVYGKGAARAEQLLAKMKAARDSGVKLSADTYPYDASYTTIGIVFPEWAKSDRRFRSVVSQRRDELAQFLRERVRKRGGPEATLFGTGGLAGKTLAQLAAERHKPFEDVLIDDVGPSGASAAFFVMDEPLQARLLAGDEVMVGTDGSPTGRHPRGYGTFARIIERYVQAQKLLTLEQAVRKMSGLTAETLGVDDLGRGFVRTGLAADLVVFDPARVHERASYAEPHRLAEGFAWVLVNGVVVRENGQKTSAKPGKLLRHGPR